MLCVYLALCFFSFMGREWYESLLWKYSGLAQLPQTMALFTKANSGNALKTLSDYFLHRFPMGLSYSCHHPKCRTDPYLLELMSVFVCLFCVPQPC